MRNSLQRKGNELPCPSCTLHMLSNTMSESRVLASTCTFPSAVHCKPLLGCANWQACLLHRMPSRQDVGSCPAVRTVPDGLCGNGRLSQCHGTLWQGITTETGVVSIGTWHVQTGRSCGNTGTRTCTLSWAFQSWKCRRCTTACVAQCDSSQNNHAVPSPLQLKHLSPPRQTLRGMLRAETPAPATPLSLLAGVQSTVLLRH